MNIKRNSWHYKISLLGTDTYEKSTDSLCLYFWRLVLKSAGILLLSIIIPCLIYAYFTSHFVISTSIMVIFVVSCVALPISAIWYLRKLTGSQLKIPGENIAFEFIKAKKNKICPLIKYVD